MSIKINIKSLVLAFSVIAFFVVSFTSENNPKSKSDAVTNRKISVNLNKPATKPLLHQTERKKTINKSFESAESVFPTRPADFDKAEYSVQNEFELTQIRYVDESIEVDEDISEEEYLKQRKEKFDAMTGEEKAVEQRILELDNQLMSTVEMAEESPEMTHELIAAFSPENSDEMNPLVDVQCSESVCRMALEVTDEYAEYDAIDTINSGIVDFQQVVKDIQIRPDDSRFVTVYLVLNTSESSEM